MTQTKRAAPALTRKDGKRIWACRPTGTHRTTVILRLVARNCNYLLMIGALVLMLYAALGLLPVWVILPGAAMGSLSAWGGEVLGC